MVEATDAKDIAVDTDTEGSKEAVSMEEISCIDGELNKRLVVFELAVARIFFCLCVQQDRHREVRPVWETRRLSIKYLSREGDSNASMRSVVAGCEGGVRELQSHGMTVQERQSFLGGEG